VNKKRHFSIFARLSAALAILASFAASGWTAQAGAPVNPFVPGAWTKLAGNPVLSTGTSGAWDDRWVFSPSVILDSSTYKMWYSANSAASTGMKIGYASSINGTDWTKPGVVSVLSPTAGTWDANGVSYPTVIKEDTTYKMWYTGTDAANIGRVGTATSNDGIAWTKHGGNPVLSVGAAGSWDSSFVGMTSVVKVDGVYKMWYRGGSATGGGIGYAISSDGLVWSKYAGNPVIAGGSGGWDTTPYHPEVIFDGTGYHMWYSGCNPAEDLCQEGYATSPDGTHWTRKGMVLPQGAAGAWDDGSADHAAVLLVGSTLKMWYSGYDGATYRIGYASAAATILDQRIFLPQVIR
jgi:beta-1,2-mannobiose phosphorylase / 1,2-beta-oligomannan phosphorylase